LFERRRGGRVDLSAADARTLLQEVRALSERLNRHEAEIRHVRTAIARIVARLDAA
jgi:hypothetical protein